MLMLKMTLTKMERWALSIKVMELLEDNKTNKNPKTTEQIVVWISTSMGYSPLAVRKQITLYLETGMALQLDSECPVLSIHGVALMQQAKEDRHKFRLSKNNSKNNG